MKLKRGFCFNISISKIGQSVQTVPIFSEKRFLRPDILRFEYYSVLKASMNSMMELYSMHFRYEVPYPNR